MTPKEIQIKGETEAHRRYSDHQLEFAVQRWLDDNMEHYETPEMTVEGVKAVVEDRCFQWLES